MLWRKVLMTCILGFLTSCKFIDRHLSEFESRKEYQISSKNFDLFVNAILPDREALGFPPIPKNAIVEEIVWTDEKAKEQDYEVLLSIEKTDSNILSGWLMYFKQSGDSYRYIGEIISFNGPLYMSPDECENITFKRGLNEVGRPLPFGFSIDYIGPRKELRINLTAELAWKTIRDWEKQKEEKK